MIVCSATAIAYIDRMIIRSVKKMQRESHRLLSAGKKIGLVPTMGFLHAGHLSLIARARKHCDIVITTIFVNPTQFAPKEDLEKYPRDEGGDIRKIREAGGEIVFIPKASEIYAPDFQTYVEVEKLTKRLEGKHRQTHFRGVTTIVSKLFNITRPDVAVFGMKDFQQAIVLKRMTEDLGYPVKFIIAPTVREPGGLAMSSRNKYFSASQRIEACCLYRALTTAREMVKSGVLDVNLIRKEMKAVIKATCPTAKVDYIAFSDPDNLDELESVAGNCICSVAVVVHKVRLIDNIKLLAAKN